MNAADFLLDFALEGGAFDGAVVPMKMLPPGKTYLIKGEPEGGRRQVWTYRFTNRTDGHGRWILEPVCYVGYQGVPVE